MAAGSGEEVSSDVIREYQNLSSDVLSRMQRQGLSDQRVALISQLLVERELGIQTSEKDLLKTYQEPRGVSDIIKGYNFKTQVYTDPTTGNKFSVPRKNIDTFRRRSYVYFSEKPDTRQSILPKKEYMNIFKPSTYVQLSEALRLRGSQLKNEKRTVYNIAKRGLIVPLKFASAFTPAYLGTLDIPKNIYSLIRNPKNIKDIPSNFIANFRGDIQLLKTSPSEGVGKIAGDLYSFKIVGDSLKLTGKLTTPLKNRILKKFYNTAKVGTSIPVKLADGSIKLKVVGKIPTESLKRQIAKEGKTVTAISTQADRLIGLIRRKKIIMKPLGESEKKLSKYGKNLLKKFDKGVINKSELIKLDKLVKKSGSKGILERSFFADPYARIRPSRLGIKGIEKEATFRELLYGKATIKRAKPQILLFEKVKIQKIPKSLKSIKKKLSKGRTLTEAEGNKFLKWQQRKSGKFKPVGFITRESEITLAPGEIIKRVKKVSTVLVKGRRVPIISAKVVKPSKALNRLLKKANAGKITSKEMKQLSRKLSKESGFKYSSKISSYKRAGKKYYPIKRKLLSSSLSRLSKYKIPKSYYGKKVNYSNSGKSYIKTKSGRTYLPTKYQPKITSPPYSPGKYPPKYPKKQPPYSPPYKPPKNPPRYPPKSPQPKRKYSGKRQKISKLKSGKIPVFNVYGKSGKKFIKINKKPLSKLDALSRGTFAIDHTTSKTFKIVPAGKSRKVGGIKQDERNYFNRAGYKLREFKIRKGRAFKIKPRYIEKRKYGIDTRGEKRGLSLAKFAKQQRTGRLSNSIPARKLRRTSGRITRRRFSRSVPIRRKRRISASQRRILLKRLVKARRVLARRRK